MCALKVYFFLLVCVCVCVCVFWNCGQLSLSKRTFQHLPRTHRTRQLAQYIYTHSGATIRPGATHIALTLVSSFLSLSLSVSCAAPFSLSLSFHSARNNIVLLCNFFSVCVRELCLFVRLTLSLAGLLLFLHDRPPSVGSVQSKPQQVF